MKHLLTAALIATALASPVRGEGDVELISHVQQFYDHCNPSEYTDTMQGTDEGYYVGACSGIVLAYYSLSNGMCLMQADVNAMLKADLQRNDVSVQQAMQAMWNYARDNPQRWGAEVMALLPALSYTWPCE